MTYNIGNQETLKEARKKSESTLVTNLKKETLCSALAFLKDGEPYKAEIAIRVYLQLTKK